MATFTYDNDPSVSPLAEIRFLLQDTTNSPSAPALFTDAEITYTLTQKGSVQSAAIALCLTAARRFARLPGSRTVGDLTVTYADLAARFRLLADDLKDDALSSSSTPIPYAGGISISDEEAVRENTDRDPPHFDNPNRRWGNPGVGGSGGGLRVDLTQHFQED